MAVLWLYLFYLNKSTQSSPAWATLDFNFRQVIEIQESPKLNSFSPKLHVDHAGLRLLRVIEHKEQI
jgi:hypothetical protein